MKKLYIVALALAMCFCLAGCDEEKGASAQDILGQYANKIEDSREMLVESTDKIQEMVEEVMQNVPHT